MRNTIFIIFHIFFLFTFVYQAEAATLTAVSAQEHVSKGDTFLVEWFVDTEDQMINVVDASIVYSPQTLEVVSLSTASSAATLWTAAPHVAGAGMISFTGGIPAGVVGTRVPILQGVFKAINTGDAALSLGQNSQVLISDGIGSKVVLRSTPIIFSISNSFNTGYALSSPTHTKENLWYHDRRVAITFSTRPNESYSYSMSTNPEIIPDTTVDEAGAAIIYEDLSDGIYYFKLASRVGDGAWQEGGVLRIQIDDTAPVFASYDVGRSAEVYGGAAFASFSATDKVSGIGAYKIKSGWFDWYRYATSPEKLRRPLVGDTFLKVVDTAGNTKIVRLDFNSILPTRCGYFGILLLLIVVFLSVRFLKKHLVFNTPHETL